MNNIVVFDYVVKGEAEMYGTEQGYVSLYRLSDLNNSFGLPEIKALIANGTYEEDEVDITDEYTNVFESDTMETVIQEILKFGNDCEVEYTVMDLDDLNDYDIKRLNEVKDYQRTTLPFVDRSLVSMNRLLDDVETETVTRVSFRNKTITIET